MKYLKKFLFLFVLINCFQARAQFYLGTPDSVFSNIYKESRDFLVYFETIRI